MEHTQIPFDPDHPEHPDWAAALWNSACGERMSVSTQFVAFNSRAVSGGVQAGRIAVDSQNRPLGFVLASTHVETATRPASQRGWIDAIAVADPFQRQGIGSRLLSWAEQWLASQGCATIHVGGSLRPFVPGIPSELQSERFFTARGYWIRQDGSPVWDLARNLNDYVPPSGLDTLPCAVRPAQPGQADDLLAFLAREFPGRWHFECQQFLRDGGRISDYMLLWSEEGLQGACRLTFEDSVWSIERFYPYQLPRPWGHLGSIGIAAAARGRKFGLALLDGGLRRLHNNGVNGCVIDWTTLLDFYAKVGFEPYRQYILVEKRVANGAS